MDFDIFLTSPRWEILQIIAKKPSSPVEIAEILNTTVSYVSQQIKLLDAAGLLNKEKTGEVLKGKPRALFSLSNELMYVSGLSKDFCGKKLVNLTDHHKIILKIWSLTNSNLHYLFEKFYWKIEDEINEIKGIFIDESFLKPKIIVISESKKVKQKIDSLIEKFEDSFDIHIQKDFLQKKSDLSKITSIYDPHKILEELKGGSVIL